MSSSKSVQKRLAVQGAYTPGPWVHDKNITIFVDGWSFEAARIIEQRGPGVIAAVYRRSRGDAGVIAAAPDLLRELRDLVDRCDGAEGVREDGSNIDTRSARMLLERLEADA